MRPFLKLPSVRWMVLLASLAAVPVWAQNTTASDRSSSMTGTVVSSSRDTLVVRSSDGGQYTLFTLDSDTTRPASIPAGSQVRVTSVETDDPGVRNATNVSVLQRPAPATPGSTSTSTASTRDEPAVPPEVRRVERQIKRQARRYQAGVRAGVALDPELILIGVHAQVGPFFSPDVFLRPSVEFAFGEVTSLFALNLEAIYRLPVNARNGRWSTYVGVGPGFNFLHQNFNGQEGGKRIDFGDFKSDVGLNILGGMRYRSGMFTELKTTVYSDPSPTLRLIVGYNF